MNCILFCFISLFICRHIVHTKINDIDNFKSVNDKLGHGEGDRLLQQVSDLLKGVFRADDIVSHLGGDKFVVFLPAVEDIDLVYKRLDSLIQKMNALMFKDESVTIGESIGVAQYPSNGCTFADLYTRADSALYYVKNNGHHDIMMPNLDGFGLIKAIKSDDMTKDISIIACTEYGNEKQRKLLFEAGIDDFVDKPVSPETVMLRVSNVLRSKNKPNG